MTIFLKYLQILWLLLTSHGFFRTHEFEYVNYHIDIHIPLCSKRRLLWLKTVMVNISTRIMLSISSIKLYDNILTLGYTWIYLDTINHLFFKPYISPYAFISTLIQGFTFCYSLHVSNNTFKTKLYLAHGPYPGLPLVGHSLLVYICMIYFNW